MLHENRCEGANSQRTRNPLVLKSRRVAAGSANRLSRPPRIVDVATKPWIQRWPEDLEAPAKGPLGQRQSNAEDALFEDTA